MENEELLRWSPSSVARSAVRAAPGPDPSVLARVEALGLLGDPATLAQRTTEHLCLGGWVGWVDLVCCGSSVVAAGAGGPAG